MMPIWKIAASTGAAGMLAACSLFQSAPESSPGMSSQMMDPPELSRTNAAVADYFEVHAEDGRIYVFDDFATYAAFLQHGETPYRYMRIGGGPDGKTLVFGLTAEDKAKRSGIASVEMWDGAVPEGDAFYAEVIHDNRFYVFDRWADLQSFKSTFEAPYRFTQIGAGPGGRSIVFVLNGDNKTEKPEDLIKHFNALRAG